MLLIDAITITSYHANINTGNMLAQYFHMVAHATIHYTLCDSHANCAIIVTQK